MSQGNYKLRAEGKEEEDDLCSGPNKKGMKIKGVGIQRHKSRLTCIF